MLAPGDAAPDFELPEPGGRLVRLSDELRERSVVLYFYPADFTPICTAQACMLRDSRDELLDAGYSVIGISPWSGETHERFERRNRLGLVLLADPGRRVIKAYGAGGIFGFVRRVTFVIDQSQTIVNRVLADLRVARHQELVRSLVQDRAHEPRTSPTRK